MTDTNHRLKTTAGSQDTTCQSNNVAESANLLSYKEEHVVRANQHMWHKILHNMLATPGPVGANVTLRIHAESSHQTDPDGAMGQGSKGGEGVGQRCPQLCLSACYVCLRRNCV